MFTLFTRAGMPWNIKENEVNDPVNDLLDRIVHLFTRRPQPRNFAEIDSHGRAGEPL